MILAIESREDAKPMEQSIAASDREKMLRARNFIQHKQYSEARGLLEQINHTKAREWLAKIDEVELGDPFEKTVPPQTTPAGPSSNSLMLLQNAVSVMVQNGWTLKAQMNNTAQLEKPRSPNRVASTIAILLFSLLGSLIVCLKIANASKESVTLRVVGSGMLYTRTTKETFVIEDLDDAIDLAQSVPTGINYASAILLGIVMTIVYWFLFSPHY